MPPPPRQIARRGQRFGRWVVVDPEARKGKHRAAVVRCNCPAKTVTTVAISSLYNGDSTSCGCMPRKPKHVVQRGQRFGRLVVVKPEVRKVLPSGKSYRAASCRCDCGKRVVVPLSEFFREGAKRRESCGCWQREKTSQRSRGAAHLARLHAYARSPEGREQAAERARMLGALPMTPAGLAVLRARNKSPENRARLTAYAQSPEGRARSSEVGRRFGSRDTTAMVEANRTHGLSRHPLWVTWRNMIRRCENPAAHNYKYYGARGVQVCPEWHDPAVFIAWIEANLGSRPAETTERGWPVYSLDRIDYRGNYEPGNVRWADWSQQRANQGSRSGSLSESLDAPDTDMECPVCGEQVKSERDFDRHYAKMHKRVTA